MNTLKFELSEKEYKDAKEFKEKHAHCKSSNGSGISYIFTNRCGIGSDFEIRCNACGEIANLTDVSVW